MFGIGSTEMLVILVVALLVLGPKNLPGIARTIGKAMGEFRKVSTDFQRTINAEVALEEREQQKKDAEAKRAAEEAAKVRAASPAATVAASTTDTEAAPVTGQPKDLA